MVQLTKRYHIFSLDLLQFDCEKRLEMEEIK